MRKARVVGQWPATGRSKWRQEDELDVVAEKLAADDDAAVKRRARFDDQLRRDAKRRTKASIEIELRDREPGTTKQKSASDRDDGANITKDWRIDIDEIFADQLENDSRIRSRNGANSFNPGDASDRAQKTTIQLPL